MLLPAIIFCSTLSGSCYSISLDRVKDRTECEAMMPKIEALADRLILGGHLPPDIWIDKRECQWTG